MKATWPLGVFFSVLGGFGGALGKVLMKKSHGIAQTNNGVHTRHSRIIFFLGILGIAVVDPVGRLIAYALAPQSLIVPLFGLGVVFNAFLARRILHEAIASWDWCGAAIIFAGVTLVAASASREEADHSPEEIFDLFKEPLFLIYLAVSLLWIAFLAAVVIAGRRKHGDPGLYRAASAPGHASERIGAGTTTTASSDSHSGSDVSQENPTPSSIEKVFSNGFLRRISYGALGGSIAGQQFLMKSAAELLSEPRAFRLPESYAVWAAAICSAVGGIVVLNAGLKRFRAVLIVSVYESFIIMAGSLSAMSFFREFEDLEDWQYVTYPFAVAITIVGVVMISFWGHAHSHSARALSSGSLHGIEARQRVSLPPMGPGGAPDIECIVEDGHRVERDKARLSYLKSLQPTIELM